MKAPHRSLAFGSGRRLVFAVVRCDLRAGCARARDLRRGGSGARTHVRSRRGDSRRLVPRSGFLTSHERDFFKGRQKAEQREWGGALPPPSLIPRCAPKARPPIKPSVLPSSCENSGTRTDSRRAINRVGLRPPRKLLRFRLRLGSPRKAGFVQHLWAKARDSWHTLRYAVRVRVRGEDVVDAHDGRLGAARRVRRAGQQS